RREAHHLALVARRLPSEPIGDGFPDLPDGVRIAHRVQAHEALLVDARQDGRLGLARTVDRERRGLVPAARPESALDVRRVVVDEVKAPAETRRLAEPPLHADEA